MYTYRYIHVCIHVCHLLLVVMYSWFQSRTARLLAVQSLPCIFLIVVEGASS